MFNVCPACGQYSTDKRIVHPGPAAVCPHCGYAQPFLQLPLFVVTGASGVGKSATALGLVPALRGEAVVLDADVLWGPEFAVPDDDYRRFREVWLRLAKNVGQCGLPVVLFGIFLPAQIEVLPERRYFSAVHFLGLIADEDDLIARLQARPHWRESASRQFIDGVVRFNRWITSHAAESALLIHLLDTSRLEPEETVEQVAAWFRSHMEERKPGST